MLTTLLCFFLQTRDNDALKATLATHANKTVKMQVFNTRTNMMREVDIKPRVDPNGNAFIGVSIRFCSFENADKYVWHVLQVELNSSAEMACSPMWTILLALILSHLKIRKTFSAQLKLRILESKTLDTTFTIRLPMIAELLPSYLIALKAVKDSSLCLCLPTQLGYKA